MNKHSVIIVIGGGNMGGAIAARWHGGVAGFIHVVEIDSVRRAALGAQGMACYATLAEAPRGDVYLLAVKPQQFAAGSAELSRALDGGAAPLLLSIMAGIPLADLQRISQRAVRIMPNLPAIISESMSVLCAPALDTPSRNFATQLFAAIGAVAWVEDESQLHAVTAISGSGPAYLFALMEALQKAAAAQGLPAPLARRLVTQTMRGTALLAAASADDAATLRAQVTSKGGTTEAALKIMAEEDLAALVGRAVAAAVQRSKALAAAADKA